MKELIRLVLILSVLSVGLGDLYWHSFRGSNNRLNEANAERNNANRLFDSQNNNRGGYNVGDKTNNAANAAGTNDAKLDFTDTNSAIQYSEVFYEGSVKTLEWTVQHGCGGNEQTDPAINNCNMVLQYACDSDGLAASGVAGTGDDALQVRLLDGTTTNTVGENTDDDPSTGQHETSSFYNECKTRPRNKGLYLADQDNNIQGDSAIYTRQNPNGNRRGHECPEERDYYPYWSPSPWRDVAILTDRTDLCPYFQSNSQNQAAKTRCFIDNVNAGQASALNTFDPNFATNCANAGGVVQNFKWSLAVPDCQLGGWSRSNHLGNGVNGQPLTYNWTLPTYTSLTTTGVKSYALTNAGNVARCVGRLRYNISTDDYDYITTNSSANSKNAKGQDLITNNPTVDAGADLQGLKLAINTNQFGRTFQDRSHVFFIKQRPANLAGANIINVNVRGKRGNIVQTFPAVEYDFVPNRLEIKSTDYVHFQWTGSNTHNNNPNSENAGDGQGGDAGEGTGGTDRTNFVQMIDLSDTFPLPLDKVQNIFDGAQCWNINGGQIGVGTSVSVPGLINPSNPTLTKTGNINVDCAVWLASSGYFRSASTVTGAANGNDGLNPTLDNAPASLIGGVLVKAASTGTFNYMGSRNNNFSNRTQKGTLIIS